MSYYDDEAIRYDETRGGDARADAAAKAIATLLPDDARLVLDVAGGTGIVGMRLGRTVVSVDRSIGMSRLALTRLSGRVALGDATALPIASESVDAVTAIWLLHMLDVAAAAHVVAEAARVLRPGGVFVTTVNKQAAQRATPDDLGALLYPAWLGKRRTVVDDVHRITELAEGHGMTPAGWTTFVGVGQGYSPRAWSEWEQTPGVAALPDQDRPRSDPEYSVVSFRRGRSACPAA